MSAVAWPALNKRLSPAVLPTPPPARSAPTLLRSSLWCCCPWPYSWWHVSGCAVVDARLEPACDATRVPPCCVCGPACLHTSAAGWSQPDSAATLPTADSTVVFIWRNTQIAMKQASYIDDRRRVAWVGAHCWLQWQCAVWTIPAAVSLPAARLLDCGLHFQPEQQGLYPKLAPCHLPLPCCAGARCCWPAWLCRHSLPSSWCLAWTW